MANFTNERTPLIHGGNVRAVENQTPSTINQTGTTVPTVNVKKSRKCKCICITLTILAIMLITAGAIITVVLINENNYSYNSNWNSNYYNNDYHNNNNNNNNDYYERTTTESYKKKTINILVYNPPNSGLNNNDKNQLFMNLDTDYYCNSDINKDNINYKRYDYYNNDNNYDCIITKNQYRNNNDVYDFDAIVFDGSVEYSKPYMRNSKQLYVFAYDGFANSTEMERYWRDDFFNMTLTYRLNSNIVWQKYQMGSKHSGYAPTGTVYWNKSIYDIKKATESLNEMKKRRGNMTAFVNIKETPVWSIKRQLDIIKEMQKVIDIDIYGDGFKPLFDKESYKFKLYHYYLTFDTESCSNYIDDNFYEALKNDVVPVVLTTKTYERFAPTDSYISKKDFETFESLAEYMARIKWSTNYIQYSSWRINYVLQRTPSVLCSICENFKYNYYSGNNIEQVKLWKSSYVC